VHKSIHIPFVILQSTCTITFWLRFVVWVRVPCKITLSLSHYINSHVLIILLIPVWMLHQWAWKPSQRAKKCRHWGYSWKNSEMTTFLTLAHCNSSNSLSVDGVCGLLLTMEGEYVILLVFYYCVTMYPQIMDLK
jgi:hypothetical protein